MDRRRFLAAAATPLVLGAAPALAGRRGGTPLALVTADLESAIVAVDLSTGRVHRRVATPADPRSIESVNGTGALVAHTGSGRLTLVDSGLRVRSIEGSFEAPRYSAISPDGRFAYVTDSARHEVAIVDLRARRAIGRVPVGGPARHLSLDPRGRRLWVVLGSKSAQIAIVGLDHARGPRVIDRVRPPFLAHDVGYEPRGARVWVSSGDRNRLALYEDHGVRLVRTLASDAPPQHVTFTGGRTFVTSGDDAILRVYDRDGRLLRSAAVPAGSYNVQHGWGVVLTPSLSQGTLCVLSQRGARIEQLRVARSSHDACFVMAR
ncbi:MAG: YncE family protein [Gaiellaceae bacterium]